MTRHQNAAPPATRGSVRSTHQLINVGGRKQHARISFATPELLWKVLTAERWEVLKAMVGQDSLTIREVTRRVGRDEKAVHGDVHALLDAGLLEKTLRQEPSFAKIT